MKADFDYLDTPRGEIPKNVNQLRDSALGRTFLPLVLLGTLALAASILAELTEGRYSLILLYVALYVAGFVAAIGVGLGYRVRVAILIGLFYTLALSELLMFGVASMAQTEFLVLLILSALFYDYRATLVHLAVCIGVSIVFGRAYMGGLIKAGTPIQEISLDPYSWITFVVMLLVSSSMLVGILWLFLGSLESSSRSAAQLVVSLRENQATLRQVIDLVPESIYAKDEESRFLFVNRRSAELMGTTPDAAVGKTQAEFTTLPEEARILLAEDKEVLESGKPIVRREHSYTDRNGVRHIEETTKIPFTTRLGREKAILGISVDITERKRAEELIRRSEVHFRSLIENVSDVVSVIATDGTVCYVSPSAERVLGYPTGTDETHTAFEFLHPDDVRRVREVIAHGALHLGVVHTVECRLRHSDGHWVTVEAVGQGLVDPDGELRCVVACRDITERKLAAVERERLISAIEQAAEAVVITDTNGTIQYVNPAFSITTGYARDEVVGQNPRILRSGQHDAEFYQQLWTTIGSGKTWNGRFVNRKKDGTLFTEESAISPVRDTTGKIISYVAVKRDITHEIQLQRQLQQAQRMEAVGKLAGGVAHDFNNLLQAIHGYTELVLFDLAADDPARHPLEQVIGAAERATSLTRQLLAFSRGQVTDPTFLDINALVSNLLNLLQRIIGENIRMDLIPGHRLRTVRADRGQIEQVLVNLCVNARDAMPQGGTITIKTENVVLDRTYCETHAWAKAGRYVILSVSDTGIGMDRSTLERVFEPFFTTKEVGKGTGLGLAVVYGIVTQHEGIIHTYSEPGAGSTFTVYLPAVEREASAVEATVEEPLKGGNETILVAEDDDSVRNLAERILTSAGYTVIVTRDGEEAVCAFERHANDIDLVVLDVIMPALGGRCVLQRLRQIRPGLRALFASGYAETRLQLDAESAERMHFIQKPYKQSQLLRKIRELLDS